MKKKKTEVAIAWKHEGQYVAVFLGDALMEHPPHWWKDLVRVEIKEVGPYVHEVKK